METAETETVETEACGLNNYRAPVNLNGWPRAGYGIGPEDIDDLPGDLRFNATQPGPFNNMPLWAFSVVPREYGMPYSQYMVRMQKISVLNKPFGLELKLWGKIPIVPGPSRYGYRMMGDY